MPADCLDLKRRLDAAVANRSNLDGAWDQVEKWIAPLSGGVRSYQQPRPEGAVDWKREEIWDSTGPNGASKLAAFIGSAITNPATRWSRYRWKSKKLQDDTEANKWLEDAEDRVFAALKESDFYSEIGKFYGDWVKFGTGCIVAEPMKDALTLKEWKGWDFSAPPIRECYYEPDFHGKVLRWWRVLSWTPGQILSKFDPDTVPAKIRELAAAPDQATTRHKVAYCIWVREEEMNKKATFPLAPEVRPVGAVYFLAESGEQLGEEDGFYELPVFMVPWEQAAGSDWGKGPGMEAVADVKLLNDSLETLRMAARKQVAPSFTISEKDIVSDVNMEPGGMTVTRDPDAIKVFESGAKYPIGRDDIMDQRAQVRNRFWVDELTLKLSPQMTATEVNARIDQMNKLFSPTLSNLQSMALDPLMTLLFTGLYRIGAFLPPPPSVKREIAESGGEFDIDYEGPLSRAQRLDEVAGIERVASSVAGLRKMGFEEVALTFNSDAAVREIAKRLGTPASLLYSADEVKAKKREQEQMQAQAMAAEVRRAQGEAMQQQADAAAAVQSVPASPVPIISPEAGGGLM